MEFNHGNNKLRVWEIALLLSICISLCIGVWAGSRQRELSGKLIRLHVLAESDSPEDQEIKLMVRDRVLETLTPALEDAKTALDAQEQVAELLPQIVESAQEVLAGEGRDVPVTAEIGLESYPTRRYEDFSLPAGEYTSLRITLGEGEGQNWWCVVFPPLCMSAVEESVTVSENFSQEDLAIITENGEEYVLKFKFMEIYGALKEKFS